uniref:hypothetical protein n=1 Tax=Thaumasiovibrio occultus TaxID=1891184 RepID=UPI00131E358D|nr:hypothetical protein [Thaumasiovibrio occultus]
MKTTLTLFSLFIALCASFPSVAFFEPFNKHYGAVLGTDISALSDNASVDEQFTFFSHHIIKGLETKDIELQDKGKAGLMDLATTHNHGLSMYALAFYEQYRLEQPCHVDNRCDAGVSEYVVEWYTKADKLDPSGQTALILADYYLNHASDQADLLEQYEHWSEVYHTKRKFFSLFN